MIDDFFQEGSGCGVANEKTPVLDLDVVVENGLGGGVHLVNKSVLVEGDRGQAHCIERGCGRSARSTRFRGGGDLDQAPGEGSKTRLFLGAQIADLRVAPRSCAARWFRAFFGSLSCEVSVLMLPSLSY